MASQKTKLFFVPAGVWRKSGRRSVRAVPPRSHRQFSADLSEVAQPSPRSTAPRDEAVTIVEPSPRGSRILRIADVLPEASAAEAAPTARRPGLAQTRLQPIEDLLSAIPRTPHDDEDLRATTRMDARAASQRGWGAARRRQRGDAPRNTRRKLLVGAALGMLVCAVVAALVALRSLARDSFRRRDLHTQVADASEPAAERTPTQLGAPPPPPLEGAPVASGPRAPLPHEAARTREPEPSGRRRQNARKARVPSAAQPSPRDAVDALASGDYPRAMRSYEALAAQYPGPSAHAEAARILRRRSEAASKP